MFGAYPFGEPYFAQSPIGPSFIYIALDLCDASVLSLTPGRSVFDLMTDRTLDSLIIDRTVEGTCT